MFRDHSNYDANGLPQPLGAAGVLEGEKAIGGSLRALRANLSHHSRQHAAVLIGVIEEVPYGLGTLLWGVQHISKRPMLTIANKILMGGGDLRHFRPPKEVGSPAM